MDITVIEAANHGWIVKLGACDVPFRCQVDADRFVERLQQRLAAPHPLPGLHGHCPVTQEVMHRA